MDNQIIPLLNEVSFVPDVREVGTMLVGMGFILIPLEYFFPAQSIAGRKRRSMLLDLSYWFFTPICTRLFTNAVLAALIVAAFYVRGKTLDSGFLEGFGPVARQPTWLQAIEILILADFIDYWTHRMFHTSRFWKFHAIHHSPEQMNWISSSRMHPLNDLVTRICQVLPILALGFAANAVVAVIPYVVFYVIFIHANLRWDFGPLRYVFVSPAYHRWHHASDNEGIDKNFAAFFPIWDILFGTYYLPGHFPKRYGVTHDIPPETLHGQLVYPFRSVKHVKRSPKHPNASH